MPKDNRARFLDLAPVEESFRDAVLSGLSRREKAIPCKFLYDERGSALFDAICELPEYYLTRTETHILGKFAGEIAARIGRRCQLLEFGSGASRKVRLLLAALEDPGAYFAIDVSCELLRQATAKIAKDFPTLETLGVCADFIEPTRLPPLPFEANGKRVIFFPGSTIGNLTPEDAMRFLRGCRRIVRAGDGMLVGVDLKKDTILLERAYNDSSGVTAAFILNLLTRANRELGANFHTSRFDYQSHYNDRAGRVEMYIRSIADQVVTVAGRQIIFTAGERIHAENSYKYEIGEFQALAARSGFGAQACWRDDDDFFSVHYLRAE
ncbi:MAG TPA: L-histidine N(alpha)-methyltransferase [Alphaproteobacteria bacterium]|nr:L-histidine N(alpha)-methyltransferase [Alphaproteobacteria bacterium]